MGAPGLHLLAKVVFYGIVVLKFGGVPPKKVGIKEGCRGFVFTLRGVPSGITEFIDNMMLALLTEEASGGGTEFFCLHFQAWKIETMVLMNVWMTLVRTLMQKILTEYGLEDLDEAAEFGVVTEIFCVVGFDPYIIDLDEGIEDIEEDLDLVIPTKGFRVVVFLKSSMP